MSPEELLAVVQSQPPRPVRCKICEGEFRAHIELLVDHGFTPYQIENVMRQQCNYVAHQATIKKHLEHRSAVT